MLRCVIRNSGEESTEECKTFRSMDLSSKMQKLKEEMLYIHIREGYNCNSQWELVIVIYYTSIYLSTLYT